MNHKQIAVITEDEENICSFMETTLESTDYKIVMAAIGVGGISSTASQYPDIVLLDSGLPDMDGLGVLNKIHSFSKIPVTTIPTRTQEAEKMRALDLGADDYITKSFGTGGLLAHIRTALRHHSTFKATESTVCHVENLTTNFERRLVIPGEGVTSLAQIGYRIIFILAKQARRVPTYDCLTKEIWGPYTGGNNRIFHVNMAHIRRKIGKNIAAPEYIFTEIGVGHRMHES